MAEAALRAEVGCAAAQAAAEAALGRVGYPWADETDNIVFRLFGRSD